MRDLLAPQGRKKITHSPGVWRWVLIVMATVPFVTAAGRAIATDWFPIGDSALLYLRATDVGTTHHPWLGSWSSASISLGYDVNNPGPLYDDLMAPFAHLFSPGLGNVLGVIAINLACLYGAVAVARRVGGWDFERWVLVASAALAWVMGSELLFDIFQAHALLFPFLLTFVLLVAAVQRHAWAWPWLTVVLSLILQTHISYAYIVVLLVGAVAVVVVLETPPPRRRLVGRVVRSRTLLWCGGLFVILWSQSFIEQIFGEGEGNLSRLARSATGTEVNVGWGDAARLVAAIFSVPPWWTRQGFAESVQPDGRVVAADGDLLVDVPSVPTAMVAVPAILAAAAVLAICWWFARTRGHRILTVMAGLSLAGLAGSVVALSRLSIGPVGLAPHHTRWTFVLALLAHVTVLWTLLVFLAERFRTSRLASSPARTFVIPAVLVTVFTVANIPKYAQPQGPAGEQQVMPALRELFDGLDPLAQHQPVRYRTENTRIYEPYSSAIQLELRERDIEFRVRSEILVRQLGPGRRSDGTEPAVVSQYEGWQAFSGDFDGCELAHGSELDGAAETHLIARAEALAERIADAGLDTSPVFSMPAATDVDRDFARRFLDGDREAVREMTFGGRLRLWAEIGWVTGDPTVLRALLDEGPAISRWLNSYVALAATPDDVCA